MKTVPMTKQYRETLIPGIISMLMMTGLLALLIITGYLFAANRDDRITAAAIKSHAFNTFLKGDDIQIHSQDGVVTLTGTVASEPHSMAASATIADLPGVIRICNNLAVIGGMAGKNPDRGIRLPRNNMLVRHRNPGGSHPVLKGKGGAVALPGQPGR